MMDMTDWSDIWIVRLLVNLTGYASVIIPGYLLIRYIRKSGYLEKAGNSCIANAVRLFVEGTSAGLPDRVGASPNGGSCEGSPERSLSHQCLLLTFCSFGLLSSYLVWGLLQERIMAYTYYSADSEPGAEIDTGERFTNSQFLVFMNRILALVVAAATIAVRRQRTHRQPPLYKYSYGSFSNILSSWCQYEALKFVSFPVQVLAKAAKVIPVMLMGRIVSRRSYSWSDYVTAIAISIGLFLFLETSADGSGPSSAAPRPDRTTTVSGIVLLVGYLAFDSFTSNWQSELFRAHRVAPVEMMAGVNLFSVLLTAASLGEQGAFSDAAAFAARHPLFTVHVVILSATSAVGQLFIFRTIAEFGAVTFTIIMTVRQALAILLSCVIYQHAIAPAGIVGIVVVFAAVFARVYLSRSRPKKPTVAAAGAAMSPRSSGPNAV